MTGIGVLCAFFILVVGIAWITHAQFPVYAIVGESSAGTWLSGMLLAFSAAASLILGMRQAEWQWYLITIFFLLLAADERFMFHEQLKEQLIFNDHTRTRWFYELPVLAGAVIGMFIALMLWRRFLRLSRIFLLAAVVFGILSVSMDVLAVGIFWEDAFKLLGELAVTCALLLHVKH